MREGTIQEQSKAEAFPAEVSAFVKGRRQPVKRVASAFRSVFVPALVFAMLAACGGAATQEAGSGGIPTIPSGSDGADELSPQVSITSPANGSSTGTDVIAIAGTASDNVAVSQVTWRNATTGTSGTASGTTTWMAAGVALQAGNNVLVVTARDAAGNTDQAQTSLNYTPGSQASALLSWNPNSEPDLAGYRVYYGTSPGTYLQPRGQGIVVTDMTYTVAGLATGTRYYFAVTAFDDSGNESGYSLEVFKDVP